MSAFQAVNTTTLTVPDSSIPRAGGETTPTTPRPGLAFPRDKPVEEQRADDSMLKTPTRVTFGGVSEQAAAPPPADNDTSQQDSESVAKPTRTEPKRENSSQSVKSEDSQDVEMGENDDEDNQDGSDDDGDQSDSGRPSKKKKGMRFFCTDFPPCQLSFTRSEHLARHIRKHTGERPFQCHCSRRFSRLDNLRQHAQTVHVNEDIPGDSLAATGTRFQRQIRTDRMRPTHRSRASTVSAGGGHSRGHSRNLSTSSIASTASNMSQVSSMGNRDDSFGRRRPPTLAMAGDPGHSRARLSLDTFNPPLMGSPGPTLQTYGSQSPNMGTPASYTNADSPRFRSGLQSPGMANARPLTWAGAPTTPSRRLSVPSGQNPFQGPPAGMSHPPQYLSPVAPSNASTFSQNSSTVASPTSSVFSIDRRESIGGAESDLRRRTWHPGTYSQIGPRPATSGLGYHQAADAPQPTFATQPAATQLRLPGIESFDHAPASSLLARRQPSPMQAGPPRTQPLAPPFEPAPTHRPEHRRNNHSLDLSLQRGIHRLDIASAAPPPQPQQWRDPQHSFTSAGARPTTAPHSGFPLQPAPGNQIQTSYAMQPSEAEKRSLDASPSSRRAKRQAWYNGPLESTRRSMAAPPQPVGPIQRTSPEDSSSSEGIPTPSGTSVPEYHPAIAQHNGSVDSFHHEHSHDSQQPKNVLVAHPYGAGHQRSHSYTAMYSTPPSAAASYPTPYGYQSFGSREPLQSIPQGRQEPPNDMRRLEALVAVATGEQQAARAG